MGDPNQPISWRELSDLGEPDDVEYIVDRHDPDRHRRERGYQWNIKWPENFWLVKYEFGEGGMRRTKVRFFDHDNHEHWFYAVPWASPSQQ